jgi:hypothetical protein
MLLAQLCRSWYDSSMAYTHVAITFAKGSPHHETRELT